MDQCAAQSHGHGFESQASSGFFFFLTHLKQIVHLCGTAMIILTSKLHTPLTSTLIRSLLFWYFGSVNVVTLTMGSVVPHQRVEMVK